MVSGVPRFASPTGAMLLGTGRPVVTPCDVDNSCQSTSQGCITAAAVAWEKAPVAHQHETLSAVTLLYMVTHLDG